MHLCTGLTAASWIIDPFGEIGANFSFQLSSPTQFAKISNKKVIADNQCEKHKKLEFSVPERIFEKVNFERKNENLASMQRVKAYCRTRNEPRQLRDHKYVILNSQKYA